MNRALYVAARSDRLRRAAIRLPTTRRIVDRFVAGETTTRALAAVRALSADGLRVTVDHQGEDVLDEAVAEAGASAYRELFTSAKRAGLGGVEASVKLSALGRRLPSHGVKIAEQHLRAVCEAAATVGGDVTIDMEDHTTVDITLAIHRRTAADFPVTGVAVQAMLHRSEADCAELARRSGRVRLVKGAHAEPATVAHRAPARISEAYLHCLEILVAEGAYPMIATHDPAMISGALEIVGRHGLTAEQYEFQMLFGVRPKEQLRLAQQGHRMRVYIPYGTDWWAYFMRRMAERPANLALLLRALSSTR